MTSNSPNSLPAVLPRSSQGRQFVVYGDCCIGPPDPDRGHEQHLADVHAAMRRLEPAPQFVCFLGDMIWGVTHHGRTSADAAALRAEWDSALAGPTQPLAELGVPVYRIPGNHDIFDPVSERVWRDVFDDIPSNGPPDQQGSTYFVRDDDLLVIALNVYAHAMGAASPALGGRVDYRWVDQVLTEHADARYKLVLGHTPVFPVNGYSERTWNMAPSFAKPFWDVLARHQIDAYFCSHVIAFDVQIHRGVPQITTGGAGTCYGPHGCMPGPIEYHHLVQMAIDEQGIRAQTIDAQGCIRESFVWPQLSAAARTWRMRGRISSAAASHTLLIGRSPDERFARVEVSLVGYEPRLCVTLYDPRRQYPDIYTGPSIAIDEPFDLTIAIDPALGPGGVLARVGDGPFSSLQTDVATGYTADDWPQQWNAHDRMEIIER